MVLAGGRQPPAQQSNTVYMIPPCMVHYLYTPAHLTGGAREYATPYLHTIYCIHNLRLPIQYLYRRLILLLATVYMLYHFSCNVLAIHIYTQPT